MDLAAVMDEVASVLEEITGLRVLAYPAETISPPAGYVSYPTGGIEFDQTYGRGMDRIKELPITLLAANVTTRAARDKVAVWARGAGEGSLKALMEAHRWVSCDDLTISAVTFDVEQIASIPYLAAIFTADAVGPGGS